MFIVILIPVLNYLIDVAEEGEYVMIDIDEVFIIVLPCFFCILIYLP